MHSHSSLRRFHWWNFKNGDETLSLVVFALQMAPSICPFRFGMARQVKNLNVPLPYSLAAKNLVDGHSYAVNGLSLVQVLNRQLKSFQINLIIRRSVRSVPQRSIGSLR